MWNGGAKPLFHLGKGREGGREAGFPGGPGMPKAPCFWWCREQAVLQAKEG